MRSHFPSRHACVFIRLHSPSFFHDVTHLFDPVCTSCTAGVNVHVPSGQLLLLNTTSYGSLIHAGAQILGLCRSGGRPQRSLWDASLLDVVEHELNTSDHCARACRPAENTSMQQMMHLAAAIDEIPADAVSSHICMLVFTVEPCESLMASSDPSSKCGQWAIWTEQVLALDKEVCSWWTG
jgi:hypothetical protein